MDGFLRQTLQAAPPDSPDPDQHRFSPERLHHACAFLISRLLDVASAVAHMHEHRIYHFDIKPANILIAKKGAKPILTDMGACIHAKDLDTDSRHRVHFTWTYAHPDLQSLTSDPEGISGGGLKASALVDPGRGLARFDLFAFGKTILELLGCLEIVFGERCHSMYGFRYLHLIGCLLLDGRNAPSGDGADRGHELHGRYFVGDFAMGYPRELLAAHMIRSAHELVERLSRFSASSSFDLGVPELSHWQSTAINLSAGQIAPFSKRVAATANHPAFQRLKMEPQLGWMREEFPGATHSRWVHSIGVYGNIALYYSALLSDSEIPTFRILADAADIEHALVAGLVHDVGQSDFAHDFEAVSPETFDHTTFVRRALDDRYWQKKTLRQTIEENWPTVDIDRVLDILGAEGRRRKKKSANGAEPSRPIDGVAVDAINGPIDADKFDYVARDSHFCGVPYGLGVDRRRFLQSLSVTAVLGGPQTWLFGLAYRAKGSAAIESLLLARYQLYGSVYWHHTFRCIQAMFVHAACRTFSTLDEDRTDLRDKSVANSTITNMFYHRVVCRKPWEVVRGAEGVKDRKLPPGFFEQRSTVDAVFQEPALDFLWRCAADDDRALVELLGRRRLYKRAFELRVSELGARGDYSMLCSELSPEKRVSKAEAIQRSLRDTVANRMRRREARDTATEEAAQKRFDKTSLLTIPLVVVDFPTQGVPREPNVPLELPDHERKYFLMAPRGSSSEGGLFQRVRDLQSGIAVLRVYVHPTLHELIIRYLSQKDIWECIEDLIPAMKLRP